MLKKSQSRAGMLRSGSTAAFTLLENVIACMIIAVGLVGTYAINGQCMDVLRMAKDEASASQVLQQRIEHLRIANWQRISDGVWIRDRILNATADGSVALQNLVETVTITPYGSATTSVNTFSRSGTTATAGSSNVDLINEHSLAIRWTVTWTGIPRGKTHRREVVTVLAKGGVAK